MDVRGVRKCYRQRLLTLGVRPRGMSWRSLELCEETSSRASLQKCKHLLVYQTLISFFFHSVSSMRSDQ